MPEAIEIGKPSITFTKNVFWICIVAFFLASAVGFYTSIETDINITTSGSVYTSQWALAIGLLVASIALAFISFFAVRNTSGVGNTITRYALVFFSIVGMIAGLTFSGIMTFNQQSGIYKNTSGSSCKPIAGSAVQFFTLLFAMIVIVILGLEARFNIL